MDTCHKISEFFKSQAYECMVIGIPKTIDNDLFGIDHSPGYASAARYVATSLYELYLDASVYDIKQVLIVEVMGRNAGWLTAAAELAKHQGAQIDFIHLPEVPFNLDNFINNVKTKLETQKNVIVVVSEGVQGTCGRYIPEMVKCLKKDAFGHAALGGAASVLAEKVCEQLGVKVRGIELSLLQRCAAHIMSKTDRDEAFTVGKLAVKNALEGKSDVFVGIKRESNHPYKVSYPLLPLKIVANAERVIPSEWVKADAQGLTQEFIEYLIPLVQGDVKMDYENGLPRYAKLNKIKVTKK
jgi:6-phosphofructokinase 1